MLKTLKWVYKLGYDRATEKVYKVLENERDFHYSQAQIKAQQEASEDKIMYKDRVVSPKEHEARANEVEDILCGLDPERYPYFNKLLEMLR
jgi:hypothetical protein